jgi:hemerythrin-like metal-binding protein
MSKLTYFNIESTADADHEHQVLLCLLRVLCNAVQCQLDAESVGEILEQLIAYSEAHFMSEELLMRLNGYGDYEDHADEHIQMLDVLNMIAIDHAAGHSSLVSGKAEEVLGFIGTHMATRDRHFVDHMRNGK